MNGPDAARAALGLPPRDPARARHCPWCHARPGQPCTTARGRARTSHPSRKEAAA